jgi:hypothetical protein
MPALFTSASSGPCAASIAEMPSATEESMVTSIAER